MTTGFQPGNFVIIAGRPGMGKTSFALNMAVAAAREEVEPIAFFSLEMSNSELIQRLICAEARISMNDMRRGNIKAHQWEDISRAMGSLNELPIYLDDLGALTVSDVRSRCRRLKSTVGLAAIFIDYLQLVRPGVLVRNTNRNEELSEICRSLKATAKDLGVPIIALAQLNRGVEIRSEKRPMLADLRDSGSLEQEADVVAFLYRDGYYNPECPEPDLTEFIIAKHRNGPTGAVKLRFQREFTLFLPYGDESHFPTL
jgi:replicative DNA helicase